MLGSLPMTHPRELAITPALLTRELLRTIVFGSTCLALLGTLACDGEDPGAAEAKIAASKAEEKAKEDAAMVAIQAASTKAKAEAKEEADAKALAKKAPRKLEDCPADLEIENSDLEASIRVKAQKPEGAITKADLKKLRSLNLSRVTLEELDICLFHYMTELRELFLGPGQITDLTPITGAKKLESLRLSMNPISDLSPISGLSKMDRLDLGKTQVADLKPIEGLTLLTELMLDGTLVEDVSPLSGMKLLTKLSVAKTKVKDVNALGDLKKLEFLYITGSPLADDISATGIVHKNGTKVVSE